MKSVTSELESISSLKEEQERHLMINMFSLFSRLTSASVWLPNWLCLLACWTDCLKFACDRQMVHQITCWEYFESACPFPNTFQGQLPRCFRVTNHLAESHYVSKHLLSWILRTVLPIRSLVFTVQSLPKPTVVIDSHGSEREQQSGRIPLCDHMPYRVVPAFLRFTRLFFHQTEWCRLGHFPLNSQSHLRGKHFM